MMKNRKQIAILLFVIFCLPLSLIAQISKKYDRDIKKVQFIGRIGANASTVAVNGKSEEYIGSEKMKVGYNMGVMADIWLGRNFYFQPNIELTAKGTRLSSLSVGYFYGNVELSMNALYVQLPLLFAYKMDLSRWNNSVNVALGPYFAYGVGGAITGSIPYSPGTFSEVGFCNRPDVGLNIELSFEMPYVVLFIGYEYGFAKMIKTSMIEDRNRGKLSFHNSNSYIGIGFKI